MGGFNIMAKTKNGKRLRWTQTELDNFYRAAIIQRQSKDYLMAKSSMNRTWSAINSKLWKEFAIVQRTDDNGITYMYLADEVPARVKRRREEAAIMVDTDIGTSDEAETTSTDVQAIRTALINQIAYFNQDIGSKEVELFEMKRVIAKWNNRLIKLNREMKS